MSKWHEIYRIFAEDLSNSIEDPPNAVDYIYNSLLTLINTNSEDDGASIEVEFFYELDTLYKWSRRFSYNMEPKVKIFANKMNKFTVKNYGDLTSFVNSLDWHEGCIPFVWWNIAETLEYDTSEWGGCSS